MQVSLGGVLEQSDSMVNSQFLIQQLGQIYLKKKGVQVLGKFEPQFRVKMFQDDLKGITLTIMFRV